MVAAYLHQRLRHVKLLALLCDMLTIFGSVVAQHESTDQKLQLRLASKSLVVSIGASGDEMTSAKIALLPELPSNVQMSWVVPSVGDASVSTSPSGTFSCTSGSFCSSNNLAQARSLLSSRPPVGDGLNQDLVSSLKKINNAQVLAELGGPSYPSWPAASSVDYATTAANSLIAYASVNSLDGYDLNFQNGLNGDWVKQWTYIVSQLVENGLIISLNPSATSKQYYGDLYSVVTSKVTSMNYQAYGDQQVTSSATLAALNQFRMSGAPGVVYGVTSAAASQCTSLDRIIDDVCPALTGCSAEVFGYCGIMVVDFDSDANLGFRVIKAAYQALSGQCANVQRCS